MKIPRKPVPLRLKREFSIPRKPVPLRTLPSIDQLSYFHCTAGLGPFVPDLITRYIIPATPGKMAVPLRDKPSPSSGISEPGMRSRISRHDDDLCKLMHNRDTRTLWRYARVDGKVPPWSRLLWIWWTITPTIGRQKGWVYEAVPALRHNARQMHASFARALNISNYAAATVSQDSLWECAKHVTVAPGGGWAALDSDTEVLVRHDWFYIYKFEPEVVVMRIEHGVRGSVRLGELRRVLFRAERRQLARLVKARYRGRACVIWPPVEVDGVILS